MPEIKTYFEKNAVAAHAEELSSLGKKALIVTGRHSSRINGSLDDCIAALEKYGRGYALFDRTEENPSVDSVMEAARTGLDEDCDFVIGIGGGSPLDAAKAAALIMAAPGMGVDYMYDKGAAANSIHMPVVSVPTTCGTGSEATGVAVLSRSELKTKMSLPHRIFPALALLDAKYLRYASDDILRNTAIDAMGHMIESFINTHATDESRQICIEGLRIWSKAKDVISDGINACDDADSMLWDMLLASNYGGKAIAIAGTSVPHALSYGITYNYHVPHGMAIGAYIPGFMKYADSADVKQLTDAMGFSGLDELATFIEKNSIIRLKEKYCTDRAAYLSMLEGSALAISRNEERLARIPYKMGIDELMDIIDI